MEEILIKIPLVLQGLGAIVIVATVVVRITPSKTDDANVNKIAAQFFKMLKFLPTIGVNPQTKKIEEAYKDITKG